LSVQVKICGLGDEASVAASLEGGARYLGFVFCPRSRHRIEGEAAASLIEHVPPRVATVGLFVDPTDDDLSRILKIAPLRMIQLHGLESPERVAAVKKMMGLPVIKAVGIATEQDILAAQRYESVADYLLLDAKLPTGGPSGGKGVVFDWSLLGKTAFSKPWFLAGGLNEENIGEAAMATKALLLDVSSGVEDERGQKSPARIRAFLEKAHAI
jgi:phosphoribosylanthranilate isomerase